MSELEIADQLKSFYNRCKLMHTSKYGEMLLDDIFGINNLQSYITEVEKSDKFNKPTNGTYTIFSYDDSYDFINTLTKLEIDDMYIHMRDADILKYAYDTMVILNKGVDCTIKARGRAISHAVDVAEILINKFYTSASYKDIRICTEHLSNESGKVSNVSSMEIVITSQTVENKKK